MARCAHRVQYALGRTLIGSARWLRSLVRKRSVGRGRASLILRRKRASRLGSNHSMGPWSQSLPKVIQLEEAHALSGQRDNHWSMLHEDFVKSRFVIPG